MILRFYIYIFFKNHLKYNKRNKLFSKSNKIEVGFKVLTKYYLIQTIIGHKKGIWIIDIIRVFFDRATIKNLIYMLGGGWVVGIRQPQRLKLGSSLSLTLG